MMASSGNEIVKTMVIVLQAVLLVTFMQQSLADSAQGKSAEVVHPDAKVAAKPMSKWVGEYESVSGKCGILLVQESKITWGSCKDASIKRISVSTSKLVMAVDPSADGCGWAGFIVALGDEGKGIKSQTAAPAITISAYLTLDDYKTANRFVQCSYLKKEQ